MLPCSGLGIIKAAQATVPSHSSKSSSSALAQLWPTWPVLPAARPVLPAVLAHTQGIAKAAEELLLLDQQQQQQQGGTAGVGASASKNRRGAPGLGQTQQQQGEQVVVCTAVVNGFLKAALDIAQEQKEAGGASEALAAAGEALQAAMQLFGYPLAAAQGLGESPSAAAAVAGRRLPDAASYALMLQLAAVAGQYQQVVEIVMGAVEKKLPIQQQQQQQVSEVQLHSELGGVPMDSSRVHPLQERQAGDLSSQTTTTSCSSSDFSASRGFWDASSLQEVLAAAAGVWRDAACGDVAIMMLDGLLVAGEEQLDHPGLAAQVMAAANLGDKEYEVSTGRLKIVFVVVTGLRVVLGRREG